MKSLVNTQKKGVDKKLLFYIVFMALPIIQFCVFYIGVNFQSIMMAFQRYDSLTGVFSFLNEDLFANFKQIFENPKQLGMMFGNTLIAWFFSSFVGTFVAVLFSLYIFKRKKVGRFFKFVLFIPSILPGILLSSVFQNFVNELTPLLFRTNKLLDLVKTPIETQFIVVLVYSIWIGFGTQVLMYTGAMEQINPAVLEAGKIDGASPWQEFVHIILPSIMPTVGTFIVAGVALAFVNQINLYNFFGGSAQPEVQTIGYYMFKLTREGVNNKTNYPFLSAFGLMCTIVAIVPTFLLRKYFAKFED